MKRIFLCIAFFSLNSLAAVRLSMDSERGKSYRNWAVAVQGVLTMEEYQFRISHWNLSGAGSESEVDGEASGETTNLNSRSLTAGVGLTNDNGWNIDLATYYSSTTETKYTEKGARIDASYEMVIPLTLGAGVGVSDIDQRINFTIFRREFERDAKIDRREYHFFAVSSFVDGITLRLDGRIYSYSKAKSDFQDFYSNRLFNYYASDLVSSIGGLPEASGSMEVILLLGRDWDLSFFHQSTRLIVDDSISKRTEVLLSRYFENWQLGGGVSRSETSQTSESSLLMNLGFEI